MPEYLYHYTDEDGISGIRRRGSIRMSTDVQRDAVLGEGVYLTDLSPHNDAYSILVNNYGAFWRHNQDKVRWFVKIRKSDLYGVMKKRFGDRVIYVYPDEIDLEDIRYTIDRKY